MAKKTAFTPLSSPAAGAIIRNSLFCQVGLSSQTICCFSPFEEFPVYEVFAFGPNLFV